MVNLRSAFSSSVASLLLVSTSHAIDASPSSENIVLEQEPEIKEVIRPQFVQTMYKTASYEINEDGPESRLAVLGPEDGFLLEYHGNWIANPPSPKKSVSFHWKDIPDIEFSISDFAPESFIDSLDNEHWEAYKRGLALQHPRRKIVFEHNSVEKRGSPIVLSKPFRQIAYEETDAKGKTIKTREIFVLLNEKLYVFAFSGPKDEIDGRWRQHDMLITRMTTVE